MFKDFTQFNTEANQLALLTSNKLSVVSDTASMIRGALNDVGDAAQRYAASYAKVAVWDYSNAGHPDDVTDEARSSVPQNILASSKARLKRADVGLLGLFQSISFARQLRMDTEMRETVSLGAGVLTMSFFKGEPFFKWALPVALVSEMSNMIRSREWVEGLALFDYYLTEDYLLNIARNGLFIPQYGLQFTIDETVCDYGVFVAHSSETDAYYGVIIGPNIELYCFVCSGDFKQIIAYPMQAVAGMGYYIPDPSIHGVEDIVTNYFNRDVTPVKSVLQSVLHHFNDDIPLETLENANYSDKFRVNPYSEEAEPVQLTSHPYDNKAPAISEPVRDFTAAAVATPSDLSSLYDALE